MMVLPFAAAAIMGGLATLHLVYTLHDLVLRPRYFVPRDRALVLEMGRLALDKPAAELLDDPNLNRLFLGGHAPNAEKVVNG